MDWKAETFRVTVVLLTASVALIAAGVAGFGGSVGLVVMLVGFAVLLFALKDELARAPDALRHDLGAYGAVLWVGPLLAAVVVALMLDATPAELQALGGLVGLVGMVNYFLRPLYRLGHALLKTVGIAG